MKNINRRNFLGGVIAAGATPVLFNGCACGFRANRKINVAIIGCGRISNSFEIPPTPRAPSAPSRRESQ